MNNITEKMRAKAKDLLSSGEVNLVIGWEKGRFWHQSTPMFVTKVEDVDKLIWDEFCVNNLSKYLLDYVHKDGKIALFVKGCDSRGLVRLLQDNSIERDKVYIIGIPCNGVKDTANAWQVKDANELKLAQKCLECNHKNPVHYDELLGDPISEVSVSAEEKYKEIAEIEKMSPDERYAYWSAQYDKCIRCYACRNVCPACNCRECYVDQSTPAWQGKSVERSENQFFGVTRAMHVAGRCIECGECERVCPMNLPLMKINKKIQKDLNELFGEYEAGVNTEDDKPPLNRYKLDDPEEFM